MNAIPLEEEFEMPKVFILPGGSQPSAAIDLARCVIRTAERRVVAMNEQGLLTNSLIMTYLNRPMTETAPTPRPTASPTRLFPSWGWPGP